jgi:SAM-dependent methyltransferase
LQRNATSTKFYNDLDQTAQRGPASQMHTDVTDLRDFYQTRLGLVARRLLAQKIRAKWPRMTGACLMGYGFATPFLGSFRGEATCIGALMPAGQGALVWPAADKTLSVLVEEDRLPLPDNSIDRMLVVHGLEVAERPTQLLREMWRVLTPAGRMLIIVPNRTGVWARTDVTPFGQGRPYSRGQLDLLLREANFTPLNWDSALYLPPINRLVVIRSANTLERIGERLSQRVAGVIMVEATKEVITPIGKRAPARTVRARPLVTAGVLSPSGTRQQR